MFRSDVTLSYRGGYERDDTDAFDERFKADIGPLALMLNGYYDVPVAFGPVKPHLGAGIGLAFDEIGDIQTASGGRSRATASPASLGSRYDSEPDGADK